MRLRLILSFALVAAVSIISVVLFARVSTTREVRAFMFQGEMIDTETLRATFVDYYEANGSWAGVESLLPGAGGSGTQHGMGQGMGGNGQRLRLADASGLVLADSRSTGIGEVLSISQMQQGIELTQTDGGVIGYLSVEGGMGFGQGDELPLINRLNQAALQAGLLAAGITLALGLLLAYTLIRPVQALTRASARLAAGDMSVRVAGQGKDELGVLARSFNQMADTLQHAEDSRKAMTADIAHELRTPLAVQRAQLEALQDGIYPMTPENMQPLVEQNDLLQRLVNDLRTLALADAGELTLDRGLANLEDLLQRALERFRPQAEAEQVTMKVVITEPACPKLMIDSGRIDQVMNNLISNALRHTPAEGMIILSLSCHQGHARISVQDSGSGIPDEALPHLFERFYRADHSRSRAEGGIGLGLAIARQLARAHGGDLTAANAQSGGAIFTLHLPV